MMWAEENRYAEGPMRQPRPDNRMNPRRDDSEFKAIEFDGTLGYAGEGPPRVPDFGSMERCKRLRPRSMASITWRKCEKVREMQKYEKKRHGDGEMQGVCMENMRDVP